MREFKRAIITMPEPFTKQTENIVLEKTPTIEDFHTARELFNQPEYHLVNKIKRSEKFPFSALRYQFEGKDEIFLVSQSYIYENEDYENVEAYLNSKGLTRVKIAFRLLPNNQIQPMILKIIEQNPETTQLYKPRIAQEMKYNHFFGVTPYQFVIERTSSSTKWNLPKRIKSYLILNDLGPDVWDTLWGNNPISMSQDFNLTALQVADVIAQALGIPYSNIEENHVHRDLKPENLTLQPDSRYENIFYKVNAIDYADMRDVSSDKHKWFFAHPNEFTGTPEYLTPFLRQFCSNNARWPLTILSPTIDISKPQIFPSGFSLQKSNDGKLSLLLAGTHVKSNKPFFITISLLPEVASEYIKKYEQTFFNFDNTSQSKSFLLTIQGLTELLQMTKSFMPEKARKENVLYLQYCFETELYAMVKSVLMMIEEPLPRLNNQSLKDIKPLLSNEIQNILNSITKFAEQVLELPTFHFCNPKPRFSESTKHSLSTCLNQLQTAIYTMKLEYLKKPLQKIQPKADTPLSFFKTSSLKRKASEAFMRSESDAFMRPEIESRYLLKL